MLQTNRFDLKSLQARLEDLDIIKKDFVIPASCISLENGMLILSNLDKFKNLLNSPDATTLKITTNDLFKKQLSEKLGMSLTYQQRLLVDLEHLYEYNINELLKHESNGSNKSFLIRIFGEEGRAFLSNSFKVIDHLQVIKITLQSIENLDIHVDYCCLSDKRMYCRFYQNSNNANLGGFILSNSETGHGQLFIAPRIKIGNNGYIYLNEKIQKKHLGPKLDNGKVYYSNNSRLAIKIQKAIELFCSENFIETKTQELNSKGSYILNNLHNTILNVSSYLGIEDANLIVNSFSKNGGETAFDVVEAISCYSNGLQDVDRKFEIESKYVKLLDLIPSFDKKNS
jgi:hypothetical protein